LQAGDACGLPTQVHWCFAGQKLPSAPESLLFLLLPIEQLTPELQMLSCSVKTFAQTKETPVYQLL